MGMKQIFVNKSSTPREIELILANGSVDSMNLQPGGRASPPPGSKISPTKENSYKSFLVVHSVQDENVEQPAEVQAEL